MHNTEIVQGNEVTVLEARILGLELLICELLVKNESLRLTMNQSIHNRMDAGLLSASSLRTAPR